jgi:nucleoside diphosphate kinase
MKTDREAADCQSAAFVANRGKWKMRKRYRFVHHDSEPGENAVKAIRAMMGATNPVDAAPGTVRGDLALTLDDNLVHSSSDPEAAERELGLWFPAGVVG